MKRNIIHIDESKCNGCAQCITACAEGALKIVNGKAKLVKEIFCDGFGDCIGKCPTGALTIEVREAPAFDHEQTQGHMRNERGEAGLQPRPLGESGETSARKHGAPSERRPPTVSGGGCPGMKMRFVPKPAAGAGAAVAAGAATALAGRSELEQWPVQIHLVQPGAPFFHGRELLVLSTCAPVASADIHGRFIRGRGVVVGCPKLDNTEGYVDKLAAILLETSIPAVVVVRMAVPCCGSLTVMARQAVAKTGRSDLKLSEVIVGLDGAIQPT